MKKKIITIFPPGKNIHLVKDVGMIPYMLQREGYYDSTIAFYEDETNLPYLENEVKGLKYKKIKKIFKNEELNIFIFLLKNIFSFDIVMTFHPGIKKVFLLSIIKFLSFSKLQLYCKLDLDEKVYLKSYNKKSFWFKLCQRLFAYVDLISAESREINTFVNEKTYMRSVCIPNGFYQTNEDVINKEEVILTVGRIGTEQKDNRTLLKALSITDLKNWSVEIVGPIETNFNSEIDNFYRENPLLKEKVKFLGSVSDREKLNKIFAKSKIFVLTSLWEGFPLVFTEALSNGCYIISTRMSPAVDITHDETYGKLFPMGDYRKLSTELQKIIDKQTELPDPSAIKQFARDNFSWQKIVKLIYQNLENK